MSDIDRLRAHMDGGAEVCPTDWNGFHTPDGGKPILRVAARIKDLKDEGYPVQRTGTRNACAVYRKVTAEVGGSPGESSLDPGRVSKSPGERTEPVQLQLVPSAFDPWAA